MTTPNMILVGFGVAVSIGLLIWAVDYALVHRWFGEAPGWYWRPRWEMRKTVGALLDVSQIYAVIGVGFICLSMWAHRHPHIWRSNNWPPPGWVKTITMYNGGVADYGAYPEGEAKPATPADRYAEDRVVEWSVSDADANGRKLEFIRLLPIEGKEGHYWGEGVNIKVRPYWAWHVWPRTFYRLEVEFIGTDAFHNPASDTNDHVSIYHPGARVRVTFRSGSESYGPINMEKAVTNNSGVSYDYGAIRKLLEFLERNPGPLKVHVDLSLNGKSVGSREFDAPNNLTARKVRDTTSVWEARRRRSNRRVTS